MIVVAAIATAVMFATIALAVLANAIFANLAAIAMIIATIAAAIDKEYHL